MTFSLPIEFFPPFPSQRTPSFFQIVLLSCFNFVVYPPKDIFWSVLSRMLSMLSVNTQLKKE